MKCKTRADGNVVAAPLEDWLIARHGEMLVFQLRYQSEDEEGQALVQGQPFAIPVVLAEQLAADLARCVRTGQMQRGSSSNPTMQ